MTEQWTEITAAVRSSDPDRVNGAIDRVEEMDRDQRFYLFDIGFDDLTSIYEESDDGYVRQSVVRTVDGLTPSLAVVFMLANEDGSTDETREDVKKRHDSWISP